MAEKTRHNSLDLPTVQKQVIGVQVVEQERVSKRGVAFTDDSAPSNIKDARRLENKAFFLSFFC